MMIETLQGCAQDEMPILEVTKRFKQYDTGYDTPDDPRYWNGQDFGRDEDGVTIFSGESYELMIALDVRVLIKPDVTRGKAVKMLRKIADCIECDGLSMTVCPPEVDTSGEISF